MATLTVTDLSVDGGGATVSLTAAAGGGDDFPNDNEERTFFVVNNGGGGAITVTFDSVALSSYGADNDVAETVGAGVEKMFGPFHGGRYNDANDRVSVSYSGVTTVTVGAFRLPRALETL